MNIAEVKAQYPDLADSSDEQVVDALREAFYPDVAREDIAGKLGVKLAPPPTAPSSTLRRVVGDSAISLLKGAIAVPESAVGLVDLATGGEVGKTLENADGDIGFRPKQAREFLDTLLTPEQQAANREVQDAHGFVDVATAALSNPSVIAHSALESLPAMGAGGVIGRGAIALAPRLAAPIAGGLGEGVVTAGQQAEDVRQQTRDGLLTGKQALLAGGSGAVTGIIGALSGKLANKVGLEDVQTLLAGGHATEQAKAGIVKRVIGGAVTEGLLEELPQSVQEQVAQNAALGRPLDEGVDHAAVLGVLTGGVMGGGAQGFHGKSAGDVIREDMQPESGPLTKAVNAGIEDAAQKADAAMPAPVMQAPQTPREANASMIAAIRTLDPDMQQEALRLHDLGNRMDVAPGVRRYAQNRLDAILGDGQPLNPPEIDEKTGQPVPEPTPTVAQPRAGDENDLALARLESQKRRDEALLRTFDRRAPTEAAPTEAVASVEQPATTDALEAPVEGDVLNAAGEPFKSRIAAVRAQKKAGDGFVIAQVQGGFAVRKLQAEALAAGRETSSVPRETIPSGAAPEWAAFTPESGTKGIPRADMPQIKAGDRSALVQYLRARGVEYQPDVEIPADQLKPTQAEFSPGKVAQAAGFTDTDRSILVSSDGHVLDGHHQWLAKLAANEPVKAIRLDAPIDKLLAEVKEFPSAAAAEGATTPTSVPAAKTPKVSRARARMAFNPEADTVLQAIAKLGGIRRDIMEKEFGLAPEELKHHVPVGGLKGYPFRARGGLDLDRVMATLQEAGYFAGVADEDLRAKFEEAVYAELGGQGTLTTQGQMRAAQDAYADQQKLAAEADAAENAAEAQAEREAIMAEAGITEQDLRSLSDDDIDLSDSNSTTEEAMRAMGFDEQEIRDELAREQARSAAQGNAAEGGPDATGEAAATDGTRGAEAPAAPSPDEGLTLAAQTSEDLRAKTERESKAAADDAAEQKRLANKAKADAQVDDFALTGSDRPADVAAAAGQQGIFDEPAAPTKPKRTTAAQRAADALEARRAAYFTPGNILRGYGGFDEVLSYTPPDENGRWSVRVHHVKEVDGQWVREGKPQDARSHSTQPEERLLKNGPFARLSHVPGAKVLYAEPRQDGREFPNAPDRGVKAEAPAAPAAAEPTKIDDAGEKIGGARKDRWKERGLNLSDLTDMSEAEAAELVTKANVWKPDWKAIVDAGMPAPIAAHAKIVYDRLAAQPKDNTPVGRRRYVTMMQAVRKVYGSLTTENVAGARNRLIYDELKMGSKESPATPEHLAEAKKILFSVYKGRSEPFGLDYNDMAKVKSMIKAGFPEKAGPWTRRFVVREQNGRGLTEAGMRMVLGGATERGIPMTAEQARAAYFEIRNTRGSVLAYAPTKDAAEGWARQLYEQKLDTDKAAEQPERPHLDKLVRRGLAQHADRDVTSEDFLKDFGFRGVEFGNWAAQDERQRILNLAYDGLHDLADLLKVPPKAISLDGTLGMAFGARGGGRFAAHYEPGKLVINMTKLQGGGSLAHEWAHALDHYFGELDRGDAYQTKARGASGWYEQRNYTGKPQRRMVQVDGKWVPRDVLALENLRPEMARAFDGVMQALYEGSVTKKEMLADLNKQLERTKGLAAKETDPSLKTMYERSAISQQQNIAEVEADPDDRTYPRGKSQYAAEARKLSGKSVDGYWLRPTEMFARAFESYIFDKVAAQNAQSDYLVHGVEGERFADGTRYKGNPYPSGKERDAINAAFDRLVTTIKTKDTEGGDVAMFSRSAATSQNAADVRDLATRIASRWVNAPKIVVAANMQDEALPEAVRAEDQKQKSQGATGEPEGFFYGGTVYLLSDQLSGNFDTLRVLMHETLGHYGLRGTYGSELGTILDRIAVLNADKVRTKAREYGLDFEKQSERRQAAEEVLAEMAQTQPQLGWVQRAIAAIRTWLREHVPGYKSMKLSDDEIIRNYLLPAREFVKRGPGQTFKRAAPTLAPAAASRTLGGALTYAFNDAKDVKLPAGYLVGDLFNHAGKVDWWSKTVGTPYNLAQRHPQFKRGYDATQRFINDVSYYASEAADLAPKLLPKLESWRDIGKSPVSAKDTKAIAAPIFEGTLLWTRDDAGKPVKIADREAEAATLTSEQKAQRLFRAGKVSEAELKRWQATPLDIFDGAVRNRYEQTMLKGGIVWTDDELKSMFKLDAGQIGLYREFRAAVDRSLTNLAITDMLRFGGKDTATMREAALATGDVDRAAELLRDHLFAAAEADAARRDVLNDTANTMITKAERARDLMKLGYAPLSRFGEHTVYVTEGGEQKYFGMFESAAEASKMARQMKAQFPMATIERGTVSQEAFKLFAGVSPETLELFGDMLGLEAQGDDASSQAFQTYLKLAKANRSAMKRLIQRKGIAGFSEDAGRVLAGFVYSNARQSSTNLHMGEMTEAANDVSQGSGQLKDQAVRLVDYVKNPQEEARGLRGLLFAQYLGGSVASAMVNATQPFAVTFPYLSQFGGVTKAAKQMAAAVKDANKKATGDTALDAALRKASEDGIVSPQEVHYLMAQAQGRASLKSGDGTTLGDASAKASNVLSKLSLAWGKVFGIAEQFNRRVTFIAAYRTAVDQGIADPAAFAAKAVAETQFTFNKGNRPNWARGAIGSTLFTFKSYAVNYIELLGRMATAGEPGSPERAAGRKAALLALGVLFLMSGADGVPFVEDISDLIDGFLQRLGYNVSTKRARQKFFADLLGEEGGRIVSKGLSGLPGVPIDVSGRMGMGTLIPGTGLLTKKADHTSDVAELLGPAGDLAKRAGTAVGQLVDLKPIDALTTISPVAGRNLAKAVDMANTGMYRDDKGRKVLDVNAAEAIAKGMGFQPATVARVQDAAGQVQQMVGVNKIRQGELAADMAEAIYEKDQAKKTAVRAALARWNESNPDMPIKLNMPGVLRRVKAMREDKATRIAKSAPASMRAEVKRELAEAAQ